MELKTKFLVGVYLLTAVLALVMTWIHVPAYLGSGFANANIQFWKDALFNANPAGKFLSVDVLFLAFSCNVWMFIEARRLGLKYVYVYVIAGIVIAISVAFPLFLAARELRIAALDSNTAAYKLEIVDVITLLIVFAVGLLAAFAIL